MVLPFQQMLGGMMNDSSSSPSGGGGGGGGIGDGGVADGHGVTGGFLTTTLGEAPVERQHVLIGEAAAAPSAVVPVGPSVASVPVDDDEDVEVVVVDAHGRPQPSEETPANGFEQPRPPASALPHPPPPSVAPVQVKKRRTKNYKWREDMAKKTRADIVLRLPPLEPSTFETWEAFIHAWNQYMAQTKTLYRRRSSCSTVTWNSKQRFKTYPVPETFQYAMMSYWCTHGCIQPSRGTGVRAHLHNRFTGCTARITADVVFEKVQENEIRWFIRVRNQISQHNHRISDEIYNCYANNSSVPDDLLLGPMDEEERQQQEQSFHLQQQEQHQQHQESSQYVAADHDNHEYNNGNNGNEFVEQTAPSEQEHGTYNGAGNVGVIKEVLAEEQKIEMARSELLPLIDELHQTPSRVIHKRLQDVSEMVMHLLAKWQQDRSNEERAMQYATQQGNATHEHRFPPSRTLLQGDDYDDDGGHHHDNTQSHGRDDQSEDCHGNETAHVQTEVI